MAEVGNVEIKRDERSRSRKVRVCKKNGRKSKGGRKKFWANKRLNMKDKIAYENVN
jgi:hypothetical protein